MYLSQRLHPNKNNYIVQTDKQCYTDAERTRLGISCWSHRCDAPCGRFADYLLIQIQTLHRLPQTAMSILTVLTTAVLVSGWSRCAMHRVLVKSSSAGLNTCKMQELGSQQIGGWWQTMTGAMLVLAKIAICFKNRITEFWQYQEHKCYSQVEITGTGNRSVV